MLLKDISPKVKAVVSTFYLKSYDHVKIYDFIGFQ